jgi:glycine cleavage system aminomethyltransferase T
MSLDFLTPRGATAESPMSAAMEGATFGEHDGWRMALRFTGLAPEGHALRNTVGWADVSHLRKAEVTGQANTDLGHATQVDGAWRCPVTPDRTLVFGGEEIEDGALDVTSQFGALLVCGPLAGETIARFCALDLRPASAPPGGFRPGSIARTAGFVLVEDIDRFLLVFGAAYGQHFWEVVSDAGHHLGGRPVGVDAVREGATTNA